MRCVAGGTKSGSAGSTAANKAFITNRVGDAGFIGVNVPEEYGGSGLSITYAAAILEEITVALKTKGLG